MRPSVVGPAPGGVLPFAKGHGTGNDFVLIPDPDGSWELKPDLVAALCDRRTGIGGDGLIRLVRTAALPGVGASAGRSPGAQAAPEWFMDYRNADGSIAEMCGNGVRVFVAELLRRGWARLDEGEALAVGTRAGVKLVRRFEGLLCADLGGWFLPGGEAAQQAGADARVAVRSTAEQAPDGAAPSRPGLRVDVGNPHVVVALASAAELAAADLSRPPAVTPVHEHGVNVELVLPEPPTGQSGRLVMRVHERGSGETQSCGTGAAAAVIAARAWAGGRAPRHWAVEVPGGALEVRLPDDELLSGESVELAGPAEITAVGEVEPQWLSWRG